MIIFHYYYIQMKYNKYIQSEKPSYGNYILRLLQENTPNQEVYVCSLSYKFLYYILTSNHLLIVNNELPFPEIELIVHLNAIERCSVNRNSIKIEYKNIDDVTCHYIFCNKYRSEIHKSELVKKFDGIYIIIYLEKNEIDIKVDKDDPDVYNILY